MDHFLENKLLELNQLKTGNLNITVKEIEFAIKTILQKILLTPGGFHSMCGDSSRLPPVSVVYQQDS